MFCIVCQLPLSGLKKKYCSKFCKSKNHYSSNTKSQKLRGLNRKEYLVNMLGGKCSICGYNKSINALCFHHNHSKKFTLDRKNLRSKSLDKLIEESSKCTLLCSNCHMESHHSDLNMNNINYYNIANQKKKAILRKLDLINKSGGKCSCCNYNENMAALCFHHIDPKIKSIKLDFRSLGNNSLDTINKEFVKCQLVCSNCHLEIHSNEFK
jgi:hypothetical protein